MDSIAPGQNSNTQIGDRLDAVNELVKGYDGKPVTKSLIRRSVLRCILHLPVNHGATEALDLFYGALERATVNIETAKARSKAPNVSNLVKIWLEARKAIEITTNKMNRLKHEADS